MMADDNKPIHELRFDAAVKVIQSLPADGSFQPSNEMMLKFYSYYKQATQGPCNIPRPGFWDPVGKVKWDAWNALGEMSREEAMTAYVDEMKLILESMPVTDEVERLLKILGPFYEMVDEKKVNQVSDLSGARLARFARQLEGIGDVMGKTSKAVTKSIIRNLEMNGSLDDHMSKLEAKRRAIKNTEDDDIEEEEEEDEEEIVEVKKAPPPRKKGSSGKPKAPLSNGSVAHGGIPLTNGTHSSKSALNGNGVKEEPDDMALPDGTMEVNGHLSDLPEDMCSHQHVASDSDSEVYCDSVDQFGMEEGSEVHTNHAPDLEDNHHSSLSFTEELGTPVSDAEDLQAGSEGVQHGGEDGKTGSGSSHRHRIPAERADNSLVRRSRGSRSSSSSGGIQRMLQGNGGDGERWGSEGAVGGNLNEQIVTALARLQEDMQSVLQRLHTLEALTASQARSLALSPNFPSPHVTKRPSWWPFEVSPGTVAFAVVWPFVVQWLIRLYLQRRRRRIH
ncbi:acyl-CoA-binding domain-containing protein 5A isoform X1 [Alosa sapidissima]|uniref:acyl-CoA-binding domain-containing protein 5A isoform X1 n=1 Tax=Alosa sapidissima TaxID=34773 RepID=UPI001C0A456B|nr:acyl-CoA-binding domain-containing protein 5A isoform X1 [Alosa sapidissima]